MKTMTFILKSSLYFVPLLVLIQMDSAIAEESQVTDTPSPVVHAQAITEDKIKKLNKQSKAKSPPLEIKSNSPLIKTRKNNSSK